MGQKTGEKCNVFGNVYKMLTQLRLVTFFGYWLSPYIPRQKNWKCSWKSEKFKNIFSGNSLKGFLLSFVFYSLYFLTGHFFQMFRVFIENLIDFIVSAFSLKYWHKKRRYWKLHQIFNTYCKKKKPSPSWRKGLKVQYEAGKQKRHRMTTRQTFSSVTYLHMVPG